MNIADLRSRIIITPHTVTAVLGRPRDTPGTPYNVWANVDETSGGRELTNAAIDYARGVKITKRYQPATANTSTITYKGILWTIHRITRKVENKTEWEEILAYSRVG